MSGAMTDRVTIVTGGSRGIGRAVAEAMVRAGGTVYVVSRKADACRETAEQIGGGCRWAAANAGSAEDADRVVAQVVQECGRLDVLVNNAATNPYVGPTIGIDLPRWEKTVQVNLTGPLVWSQAAWRHAMSSSGDDCAIVNVSSVGGLWTSGDHGAYDVTKAGLIHLTKQLAAELGPRVRVNSVAPGLTRTDINASLFTHDGAEEQLAADYPLRRLGRTSDIAGAVLFMASPAAGWITGQTLVVDGGGQIGLKRVG